MYKDLKAQKKASNEAVKRYRDKKKGITGQGITLKESEYPAILRAICDPIKREKLERITRELKAHGVSESVRYGIDGPTFDQVGELLDCVKI